MCRKNQKYFDPFQDQTGIQNPSFLDGLVFGHKGGGPRNWPFGPIGDTLDESNVSEVNKIANKNANALFNWPPASFEDFYKNSAKFHQKW